MEKIINFIKKHKILLIILLLICLILIVLVNQLKVSSIKIDIDYVNSKDVMLFMSRTTDDQIVASKDSNIKFTVDVLPKKLLNKSIKWKSSNSAVATIENNTLVIHDVGTVEINAESIFGVKSNKINIIVKE